MKAIALLCMTAAALLLASCASPIERRIEHNPALFNALSPRHKEMVRQGRIEEGMTRPAVFIAWGKPDRAAKGTQRGRSYERWSYAGYDAVHTSGLGFGIGVNHWSQRAYYRGCFSYDRPFIYEPMISYIPYEAARVEFLDGIVIGWSATR